MAVPAAVAQSKVTLFPLAADGETVNVAVVVPALPSVTETSFTERVGAGSLSVIVPTPWASPIWPGVPTRFVRFTTNVSFDSSEESPTTETVTTLEVAAFVSVTVPEDAVKSPGAFAEPGAVAQLTWREQHTFGGGATWIVKEAVVGAPVPSTTVASEIVTAGVGAADAGDGRESTSMVAVTVPATRRRTTDGGQPRTTYTKAEALHERTIGRPAPGMDTRSRVLTSSKKG